MTPNHPIPPERIRAEAERIAQEMWLSGGSVFTWDDISAFSRDLRVSSVVAGIEYAASLVDVSAVQREAARKAWDAAMELARNSDRVLNGFRVVEVGDLWVERDRYLAREYPAPAPAPRECVLSDGSVVTVHDGMFKRYGSTVGHITTRNWRDLADTGADFDALKQFAERAK